MDSSKTTIERLPNLNRRRTPDRTESALKLWFQRGRRRFLTYTVKDAGEGYESVNEEIVAIGSEESAHQISYERSPQRACEYLRFWIAPEPLAFLNFFQIPKHSPQQQQKEYQAGYAGLRTELSVSIMSDEPGLGYAFKLSRPYAKKGAFGGQFQAQYKQFTAGGR